MQHFKLPSQCTAHSANFRDRAKEALFRMDPSCWDSSRAVLPGNIVKGQSVSSLCFLAAQVPTLQMKASHQKPIHFLAITAWNQAGDLAASDIPCYIQETEVYLACQFLSTVLVSLGTAVSCNLFISFASKMLEETVPDVATFSEDEDVDVAMSIYTLNFSRSFHDCLKFVHLILAPSYLTRHNALQAQSRFNFGFNNLSQ